MTEQPDTQETGRRLVYFAAERTLMAWIRTALGLMALGFVIDRFGLVLRMTLPEAGPRLHPKAFSRGGGRPGAARRGDGSDCGGALLALCPSLPPRG